jgi:hypothetical protein
MRNATFAMLLALAVACTGTTRSGTFSEVAIDTAATSSPAAPLLGGGTSFGMCAGYCRSEVVVRSDGRVVLELSMWGEHPHVIRNRGRLVSDALERARAIAAELHDATLKDVYGCPDCADGGAASVQTWERAEPVRATYGYGQPPAELARADRFLAGLIDALDACKDTGIVTVDPGCTPKPSY